MKLWYHHLYPVPSAPINSTHINTSLLTFGVRDITQYAEEDPVMERGSCPTFPLVRTPNRSSHLVPARGVEVEECQVRPNGLVTPRWPLGQPEAGNAPRVPPTDSQMFTGRRQRLLDSPFAPVLSAIG